MFECHCVLLCTTLLRRRVTELSNLCGLAQVRAVKKSCHAALVFSQQGVNDKADLCSLFWEYLCDCLKWGNQVLLRQVGAQVDLKRSREL